MILAWASPFKLCQNDGSVLTSFVYYKSEPMLSHIHDIHPTNTKHLYNIYTMLEQSRRRWADIVGYICYKCFVFAGQ